MDDTTQVFEGSAGSVSNNISDLFTPPPFQVSVKNSSWSEWEPIQTVNNRQPTIFVVGTGETFLDLSQVYLYCKMKLEYRDGTKLKEEDMIASVNCPLFSQFASHKLFDGQEELQSIEMFQYNQILLQLLNNSRDSKASTLSMAGFFEEDDPSKHNTAESTVFKKLQKKFKQSNECEFLGRLNGNLFDMKRLFAPGRTLRFEFMPSSDQFFILDYGAAPATRDVTRVVTDIRLITRQVTLMGSLALAIANQARLKPYIYPYSRVIQKSLYIGEGATAAPFNYISMGVLASRCIVALVSRLSFNGTIESNPYSFQHHGVKSCYLRAGSELFPADALKRRDYDFKNNKYCMAYKNLLDCMQVDQESGLGLLNYESFGTNNCLFAFDLTSNQAGGDMQLWKTQNLQLNIDFGDNAVPQGGLQAIIVLELQSIMQLDTNTNTVVIDPPSI